MTQRKDSQVDFKLMKKIFKLKDGHNTQEVLHAMLIYICGSLINSNVPEEGAVETMRHYYQICKPSYDKFKANT